MKRAEHPDFVAASPRGLVPALDANGEKVHESLQLVEYIDERFVGPPLLPGDAHARARVRIWVGHCADQIQKHYYTMLLEQEAARRDEAKERMFEGIRTLAAAMSPSGPFFLGTTFSMFEIAVAPFWQRYLWVGQHYRDLAFPNEPAFERLATWWAAVAEHPAVAATLVCRPRLVASYSDYAVNKGTSEYAKSLQQGLSSSARAALELTPRAAPSGGRAAVGAALAAGLAIGAAAAAVVMRGR